MSIALNQLNQTQLATFVLGVASGNFSGILGGYTAGGGALGTGVLSTTGGNQNVATNVTFLTNPTVPYSGGTGTAPSQQWVTDTVRTLVYALSGTTTGAYVTTDTDQGAIGGSKGFTGAVNLLTAGFIGIHAATLGQLSGASGILSDAIASQNVVGASGALETHIASTGHAAWLSANGAANTLSGNLTNSGIALQTQITSLSGFITGISGVIKLPFFTSFYSSTVATGLNLFESFTARSFTFTGAAFSCRTSGNGPINGGTLTGKLYQVDSNNTEQTLYSFTFDSGIIYSGSPVFSALVTGGNRVGISIINTMSGIDRLCIGVFGQY